MMETDRCVILPVTIADEAEIIAIMTDPDVRRYLGGVTTPLEAAERTAQLSDKTPVSAWSVFLKANSPSKSVGLVQVAPYHDGQDIEISYQFVPAVWGKKIALEAVGAILTEALQSHVRIVAETQKANISSRRLLERLGMVQEREITRFGTPQIVYSVAGPHRGSSSASDAVIT